MQTHALLIGALNLALDMLDTPVFNLRGFVNMVKLTPELIPEFLPFLHFFFRRFLRLLLLLQIVATGFQFRRYTGKLQFQLRQPVTISGQYLARLLDRLLEGR